MSNEWCIAKWKIINRGYIAVDSSDNVYVSDTDNNRILEFDSNGKFITKWEINSPYNIALDLSDNLYITSTEIGKIQIYAPNSLKEDNSNEGLSSIANNNKSSENNQSNSKVLVCELTQYCSNPKEGKLFSAPAKNNDTTVNYTTTEKQTILSQRQLKSSNSKNITSIPESNAGISDQF